ncbi:MAG: cation-translocating P-type ATPase [Holophagales bacterium]|nr:cation-translocating P-type ATPase [Holophagales bacterium]
MGSALEAPDPRRNDSVPPGVAASEEPSPDASRRSAEDVLKRHASDGVAGLGAAEAAERLEEHGPNELTERAGRSRLAILREQLFNVMTFILLAAAALSAVLGDWIEAVVILVIVVLNAVLGYTQEHRAERSMAALARMSVPTVKVRREGRVLEISSRELVPGDVVLLETGNVVPADARVLSSVNLRAQESALTGESEAVEKDGALVFTSEKPLAERRNMVYAGTVVTYGRGEAVVTATGMATQLGKIAGLIQSVVKEKTPLQKRLDRLGRGLAIAAGVLVAVVFLLGIRTAGTREEVLQVLLTAVSLAVAAIPEAMTAVVTIALSLGAQRMLRRKALIRKLPAVETLGSVSVICSDKTGTLTQNRMTVTAIDIANRRIDLVQREDGGHLTLKRAGSAEEAGAHVSALDLLLVGGALCNDAVLAPDGDPAAGFHAVGDPTESALVLAAAEYGARKDDLDGALPRVAELPFDSVRKRMTTVHRMPVADAQVPAVLGPLWARRSQDVATPDFLAVTKGAVDGLLEVTRSVWVDGALVPLDDDRRRGVMKAHDDLAAKGMRILGVAVRPVDHVPTGPELSGLETDLILVGLFGLLDPARPEVTEAVARCREAGIRTVMITGDHPLTAGHIARQVGITESDEFLTGQDLDGLQDEELRESVHRVSVFARVAPEHKIRLVSSLQEQGLVVAMTGDGVNDAPALRKADIGVAMGITGTDVARDAAEMVLLDDNFATIVAAVEEGRKIYDNIRKFIKYLLSCNASEIAVMLLGPLLGMPLPLLPLQILWMNLVTDGLPALALGVEPAEKSIMKRPPTSSEESIFGRGLVAFVAVMGVVMSLISLGIGLWAFRSGDPAWQTLLFTTLIFSQVILALEVRSERTSLFRLGLFTNPLMVGAFVSTIGLQVAVVYVPFLQKVFKTAPLGARDLLIAFGSGLTILVVVEVWKLALRRMAAR